MPAINTTKGALDGTWRDLRSLAVGIDTRLIKYMGLDRSTGKHIIQVSGSLDRRSHGHEIFRNEARHRLEGLALAQANPNTVRRFLALDDEPVPTMLLVREAAERIPSVDPHGYRRGKDRSTLAGMEVMFRAGLLYPVYGPDQARRLFAIQVEAVAADRVARALARDARLAAEAGKAHQRLDERAATAQMNAEEAEGRWAELEKLLPPAIALPRIYGPAFPPRRHHRTVVAARLAALATGTAEGWFDFKHPTETGDGYVVDVPVGAWDPLRREVPAAGVLPWVEGFACWHHKDRLAFR